MTPHFLSAGTSPISGQWLREQVAVTLDETVALENAQQRYCELYELLDRNRIARRKKELERALDYDALETLPDEIAQAREEIGSVSRTCSCEIRAILSRALVCVAQAKSKEEARIRADSSSVGLPFECSQVLVALLSVEASLRYAARLFEKQSSLPPADVTFASPLRILGRLFPLPDNQVSL